MNLDQQTEQEQSETIERLTEHYAMVERYEHRAVVLKLMEREKDAAGE